MARFLMNQMHDRLQTLLFTNIREQNETAAIYKVFLLMNQVKSSKHFNPLPIIIAHDCAFQTL